MANKYSRNPFNTTLYYISRLCHLYPLNFDFNKKNKFKHLHRFTTAVFTLSLIGIFVWNYIMKYFIFYRYVNAYYMAADISLNVLLTFCNISCMVLVQRSNQWEILLNLIFKNAKKKKYVRNNLIFYLVHGIQVVWLMSELYMCAILNSSFLSPIFLSLIDKINIYMVQTSSLLMNGYVSCMKENVVSVRVRIQREIALLKRLKATEKNVQASFEKFTSLSEMDDTLNFLVQVLKGIDAFNKIYGVQILGLSGVIMMFLTNTCCSMVFNIEFVVMICMKSYISLALLVSEFT